MSPLFKIICRLHCGFIMGTICVQPERHSVLLRLLVIAFSVSYHWVQFLCISNALSRLILVFQISKLHHVNVWHFMCCARWTWRNLSHYCEFMIDGSMRHVLLHKDKYYLQHIFFKFDDALNQKFSFSCYNRHDWILELRWVEIYR